MNAARVLRMARRRAALSQRELANRAGVAQSTVARIESGAVDPTISMLERLLRECGERLESEPDLAAGVDRTLIRSRLRESPRRRLEDIVAGAAFVEKLRDAKRLA